MRKTCGLSSALGMVPQSSLGVAALDAAGPPACRPLASSKRGWRRFVTGSGSHLPAASLTL
eukprot:1210948-Pyramimonas_sp.AAC.1